MIPGTAVPIPLGRLGGALWTLPVQVGGRDAVFVFDTAAGVTMLDASLIAELGLETYGRLTGHRMSGARVDFACADSPGLTVGGEPVDLEVVGAYDLNALLPEEWPRVDGVLALDAFARRALTIDLAAAQLVLETPHALARRERELRPLRIRAARGCQGAALDVFAAARGRRGAVWLELDTGNTGPAILAPHAIEELGLAPGDPIPIEGLGPTALDWVESELIYDGNLGASFLASRVLTLDLATERAFAGP